MEDRAGISKHLEFLDIDLVGVHDGNANTVMVGLVVWSANCFERTALTKLGADVPGALKEVGKPAGTGQIR
jgi:hypothetical protein